MPLHTSKVLCGVLWEETGAAVVVSLTAAMFESIQCSVDAVNKWR